MSKPQTRAEAHADSPARTVRQSRARVRAALERHAVGRENAMSGAALAERVPLKATTVRDIVAELRDEGALPIGNCADGYYVISQRGELHRWVESKTEEIATARETRETVIQAFNRRLYGGGVDG